MFELISPLVLFVIVLFESSKCQEDALDYEPIRVESRESQRAAYFVIFKMQQSAVNIGGMCGKDLKFRLAEFKSAEKQSNVREQHGTWYRLQMRISIESKTCGLLDPGHVCTFQVYAETNTVVPLFPFTRLIETCNDWFEED